MSGPLITRKGILTFDKQITGGRGVGGSNQSPVPMGLLQQCVGVGWPSGFVIYAACSTNSERATIAVSKDGASGWSVAHFPNAGAVAGIAGQNKGKKALIVGGYYTQSVTFTNGPFNPITFNVSRPQFWISTDSGKTWSIDIPSFDTSFGGDFDGQGTPAFYTSGYISGMGYDPDTETFYAAQTVFGDRNIGTGNQTLSGQIQILVGGINGFVELRSESLFTHIPPNVIPYHPIPTPWPSGIDVVDTAISQDDDFTPPRFIYAFDSGVHFASVSAGGQELNGGPGGNASLVMNNENQIASTVGGTNTPAASATISKTQLAILNTDGTVTAVPIDPATTSGGGGNFGSGFNLAQAGPMFFFSSSAGILTGAGPLPNGMATISFSGAGKSNPT